jgi:hypothetical protein
MALTPRREAFVAYYCGQAKQNASEAARLAGYAKPGQEGHFLLKNPEIAEAIAAFRANIKAEGIANQQNRVDAMNDRWERMVRLIEARAEAYADGPGGHTGLVVGQLKTVKHIDTTDDDGERVWTQETWEYTFDAALTKELREVERAAATELGQIISKSEVSGPDGGAIPITGIALPLPTRTDDAEPAE